MTSSILDCSITVEASPAPSIQSTRAVAIWLYSKSTANGDRDFCLDYFYGGSTSVEIFEYLVGLLEKKDHDVVRKTG